MTNLIALIPARAGSKRAPGKNVRLLNGHPLLAYAIATAQEAGIFEQIIVSTEDEATADIAHRYGATVCERPAELAQDDSPDILWVEHALDRAGPVDAFAILRPTSPFRRGQWVRDAWEWFSTTALRVDSLRAMRPVTEHPGKMWAADGDFALPILPQARTRPPFEPWHSSPTQGLPQYWVQTAALEIAWTRTVYVLNSIAGYDVLRLETDRSAPETIDINTEDDWDRAQAVARVSPAWLPTVRVAVPV